MDHHQGGDVAEREVVLQLIVIAVIGLLLRDTFSNPPLLNTKLHQSLRHVRFPLSRGQGRGGPMLLHELADLGRNLALIQERELERGRVAS